MQSLQYYLLGSSVTMSLNLVLGRIHCLRTSLPLSRGIPSATSSAPSQVLLPNPHFTVEYLVDSCGLSSDKAEKASKYIQHLKSFDNPNSVLRFLKETGISEPDIRNAVSQDSRILCSSLERNIRPNIAKLQELGFSIKEISHIISSCPSIFRLNFESKVDSLLGTFGSVEYLRPVLKGNIRILNYSFENVIMPNLTFLREECKLSIHQIVRLLTSCTGLLGKKTEYLKTKVEEAEELGVVRSSGTFPYALAVVCRVSGPVRDANFNYFRNLGLSHEEVTRMISKCPYLLSKGEEVIDRNLQFLIKEAGCSTTDVVRNPSLLMYSLEKRLIPRNVVRKILILKGLLGVHRAFASCICITEMQFVEKFILPYEDVIPGLHQAYKDASAGNIVDIECFKSISS